MSTIDMIEKYKKEQKRLEEQKRNAINKSARQLIENALGNLPEEYSGLFHKLDCSQNVDIERTDGDGNVTHVRFRFYPDWPRSEEIGFVIYGGAQLVGREKEFVPIMYVQKDYADGRKSFVTDSEFMRVLAEWYKNYQRKLAQYKRVKVKEAENEISRLLEKIEYGPEPLEALGVLEGMDVPAGVLEQGRTRYEERLAKDTAEEEYQKLLKELAERFESYEKARDHVMRKNKLALAKLQNKYGTYGPVWKLTYAVSSGEYGTETDTCYVVDPDPDDDGFWTVIKAGELSKSRVYTPIVLEGPMEIDHDTDWSLTERIDFDCGQFRRLPNISHDDLVGIAEDKFDPLPEMPDRPEWIEEHDWRVLRNDW